MQYGKLTSSLNQRNPNIFSTQFAGNQTKIEECQHQPPLADGRKQSWSSADFSSKDVTVRVMKVLQHLPAVLSNAKLHEVKHPGKVLFKTSQRLALAQSLHLAKSLVNTTSARSSLRQLFMATVQFLKKSKDRFLDASLARLPRSVCPSVGC